MAGARQGGNFMIGGDDENSWSVIEPIFKAISTENGYLYTGKLGSGHYLKMIHNGIEYGMMQAIAEGFEILEESPLIMIMKPWQNYGITGQSSEAG